MDANYKKGTPERSQMYGWSVWDHREASPILETVFFVGKQKMMSDKFFEDTLAETRR
jgi:hypothetical protein